MFTLIEIENSAKKGVYRFLCDTIADLQSLPNIEKKVRPYGKATAGTMAFVVSENQTYILSPSNKWIKISTGSGSGSSGGVVDLSELYTTDENGNKKIKPSLLWSNIYVGSGEAPNWADVQIDPSGSEYSSTYIVNVEYDSTSKKYISDKTFAEIKDAGLSSKNILVFMDGTPYFPVLSVMESSTIVRFARSPSPASIGVRSTYIDITENDEVTFKSLQWYTTSDVATLPTPVAEDEGKILMCVNGAWKPVSLSVTVDEHGSAKIVGV